MKEFAVSVAHIVLEGLQIDIKTTDTKTLLIDESKMKSALRNLSFALECIQSDYKRCNCFVDIMEFLFKYSAHNADDQSLRLPQLVKRVRPFLT